MSNVYAERNLTTGLFEQSPHSGHGGVAMYLTWENLEDLLRREDLCRKNEYVSRINVDADGIQVYFERYEK
jgi:hypothetical protein